MSRHIYETAFDSNNEVINVGKLSLPSGEVVAVDPFFCADAVRFQSKVTRGDYAVQLCAVDSPQWGQRIALARIVFSPGAEAASFEKALKESTDSAGYFVDSGLGSFMDEVTRQSFSEYLMEFYRAHPRGNYYGDVLSAEFKRNARSSQDIGKWVLHYLPEAGLNIAMFASGHGDGFFESFWGRDQSGEITSLVTDFGIL